MSSTLAPFGFRPSFHDSGNIRAKAYTIASGYGTSIYCGDYVKLVDAGVINLAAAGDTGLGMFMGCEYKDSLGSLPYPRSGLQAPPLRTSWRM